MILVNIKKHIVHKSKDITPIYYRNKNRVPKVSGPFCHGCQNPFISLNYQDKNGVHKSEDIITYLNKACDQQKKDKRANNDLKKHLTEN